MRWRRLPEDGIRFSPPSPRSGGASSIIGGRVEVCLRRISRDSVGVCLRWIHVDPVFVRLCSCVYMLDSIFVLLKFTLFIEFAEWPCPGHSAIAGQKDANLHLLGRTDLWPNAGHCFLLLFWEVPGTVLCFAGPAKQTWMMSSRVGQAQMPHPSFQSREFQ